MKIGVLAPYLDTRADVRDLIRLLALENEVTIYLQASDADRTTPLLPPNQRTVILPRPVFGLRMILLLWQYAYLAFGKIPRSRYNYYMVERIRLSNKAMGGLRRFVEDLLIRLSKYAPQFISYDSYLHGLSRLPSPVDLAEDIDVFFCNTQIYDDRLYAHILRQDKRVWTYVYSWDHPCKMKTFSQRTHYLVWNEGLKNDLIELQGIDAQRIKLWGATQFSAVQHYLTKVNKRASPYSFPYLYLGCATGYDELVVQEVNYIAQIARAMAEILPDYKLLVRPYPFQKQWDKYASLRELSNVVFDDSFRKEANGMTIKADMAQDKLWKIQHAHAFLHFGTTMGYEACYFDVPSCLMAFVERNNAALLHGFIHQYQNDKYLYDDSFLNVATCTEKLLQLLEAIRTESVNLLDYNRSIRRQSPLRSLPEMNDTLLDWFNSPLTMTQR